MSEFPRNAANMAAILSALWLNADMEITELRLDWRQVDQLLGIESDPKAPASELPVSEINSTLQELAEADELSPASVRLILEDPEEEEYYILREYVPRFKVVTADDLEAAISDCQCN
jgi:hypothetical protein